jgi:hypothetical protein
MSYEGVVQNGVFVLDAGSAIPTIWHEAKWVFACRVSSLLLYFACQCLFPQRDSRSHLHCSGLFV